MSLDVQKSQLVSDLPLSVSGQRESQKLSSVDADRMLMTEARSQQTDQEQVARIQDTTPSIQQLTEQLNDRLRSSALKFEVVTELNTTVIKVIDLDKNEVIRQIPSEEMLNRLREINNYLDQTVYNHEGDRKLKDNITGLLLQNNT